MKNIYFKIILLVLFLGLSNNIFSQTVDLTDYNTDVKVIPPSPEANALGTFGTIPVGLHSGTIQYSIPLYTVQGINLSVPISLNYNTNGIKLEDISTWVGAGWTLDAGGLITRSVRGELDELNIQGIPELTSQCITTEEASAFEGRSDLEYDIFSYNFLGHSGSFIIKNNIIIPIEKSELIFYLLDGSMNDFVIKDGDGTKYYFGKSFSGQDSAIETTVINEGQGLLKTAWYLTKIEHFTGESMYFEYDIGNTMYHFDSDYSQTKTLGINELQRHPDAILYDPYFIDGCLTCNNVTTNSTSNLQHNTNRYKPVYLKRIINYNFSDSAEFITTNRAPGNGEFDKLKKLTTIKGNTKKISFDITEASWYRLYLNSVSFKYTSNNTTNEVYSFEYNELQNNLIPERSGAYRDYWGYYNGKNNIDLVNGNHHPNINVNITQQGTLKKIIFPTKGYTEIEYEPNSKSGGSSPPTNCSDFLSGWIVGEPSILDQYGPGSIADFPFTVNVNQEATFELNGEYFPNLQPNINSYTLGYATFNVLNSDTGEIFINEYLQGNQERAITVTLPPGNYYALYSVKSEIYHVKFKYTLCLTSGHGTSTLFIKGGIRVKQTKNYSSEGKLALTKGYIYSLEQLAEPILNRYIYNQTEFSSDCTPDSGSGFESYIYPYCVFNQRQSSPYFTNNQCANPFFYGKVTEFLVENTATRSEITHIFKSAGIFSPPLKKFSHSEDYIIGKYQNTPTFFNTSGLPYEIQTIEYETFNDFKRMIKNTTFKYDFSNDSVELYPSYLVDNITKIRLDWSYIYNGLNCFGADLAFELNAWKYNHISAFRTLNSKEVVDIIYPEDYSPYIHNEKRIVNKTNYFYQNPIHKQVTKIENFTSEKSSGVFNETKKETTKYFYPSDITNPVASIGQYKGEQFTEFDLDCFQNLKSTNRVTKPIQIEKYSKEDELISIDRITYKKWIFTDSSNQNQSSVYFPEKIKKLKIGIGSGNILEDKIIFKKYSRFGNVLELKNAFGPSISYIYGYNRRYVIGVLENVSYDELTNYSSAINELSDYTSYSNVISFFNNLRNVFPNSMITSYTYNPLIGITSKTDPKGYIYNYTYDIFNRLERIYERDKFIIKEFKYNYRP